MDNLKSIRQGKYFEIEILEKDDAVNSNQKSRRNVQKLLVNLIIEDYKINKL